jgi:hypothetical protein
MVKRPGNLNISYEDQKTKAIERELQKAPDPVSLFLGLGTPYVFTLLGES